MPRPVERILYWSPRVLSLAFVGFLSLFALDVFCEARPFWQTLLALGIHLIPSAVLLGVIALAWRWEWIGTLLFAAAGVAYWAAAARHPSWVLVISGPMFLVALLYLLNWVLLKDDVIP